MDERSAKRIWDWLARLDKQKVSRHTGTVSNVVTGPPLTYDVTIAGATHSNLTRLASYTPVNGDRVEVLRSGRDFIVQGKLVTQ